MTGPSKCYFVRSSFPWRISSCKIEGCTFAPKSNVMTKLFTYLCCLLPLILMTVDGRHNPVGDAYVYVIFTVLPRDRKLPDARYSFVCYAKMIDFQLEIHPVEDFEQMKYEKAWIKSNTWINQLTKATSATSSCQFYQECCHRLFTDRPGQGERE